MATQPGLGVPENSRAALANSAAGAFETYSQLLLTHADEFDAAELSVSSIERFETRVREIANQLREEATFLRQRSGLRVAGTAPVLPPLMPPLPVPLDRMIDEVRPS